MNKKNEQLILKWFKKSQESNVVWEFNNSILYKMCNEHPGFDREDIIIGKLMLIGRSYAAALERTKVKHKNYNIYLNAAKKIITNKDHKGKNLHQKLKSFKEITAGNDKLIEAVDIVVLLNDSLSSKSVAGINKVSLCSKVLHFHDANFPIYDSLASRSLTSLVPANSIKKMIFFLKYIIVMTSMESTWQNLNI